MKRKNIQNHTNLSIALASMAQSIRDAHRGKELKDEVKAAVKHLESMSIEHLRTASVVPSHNTFIRK